MKHLKLFEDYGGDYGSGKWARKPAKWSDVDPEKNYVDYFSVQNLPHYEDWELWPLKKNEESRPLEYFENRPKENVFVISVSGFEDGQEFLVYLSGYDYVRMARMVVGGPANENENESAIIEESKKITSRDLLGPESWPYIDVFVKKLSFGDKLTKHDHGFLSGTVSYNGRGLGRELRQKFIVLGTDPRQRGTDYYVGWDENDIVYLVQGWGGNYIQVSANTGKEDWNKDKPRGKYKVWE